MWKDFKAFLVKDNIIGNVINFLVIGFVCYSFAKAFVKPKPAA